VNPETGQISEQVLRTLAELVALVSGEGDCGPGNWFHAIADGETQYIE
jgi:hypothetical protein